MILPEERILLSQDPVPEDLNDWPDFTLTDAKVRVAGSSNYANLLEANVNNPLSVTGRLSRLDNQRGKLVIYPKYTQFQIKIENCTHYAFGQDPSGKSVIWAAGKAGWFEVNPSTRYAPVYDDIVKAIDLIYFLSDVHQTFASRRPVRGAKIEELLTLYQQHTDYRVEDNAEAEGVLAKHHSFLIRQMLEGWEGIDWARTHLWSYFSRLYPDEITQGSSAGSEDEEAESEGQSEGHDSSENDSDPKAKPNDLGDGKSWVDVIFEEIMRLKGSGHMCRRHCSVDGIAKILMCQYSVASKDEASEIVQDAARSVIRRLDADPDQGRNRNWSKKFIYRQLQKLVEQEDESTNDVVTPVKRLSSRRHQKSILRPSTGAGKGKKRILKAQSPLDDETEDEGNVEETTKSPVGTDTPTKKQRLTSASGNIPARNLTNGDTYHTIFNVPTSGLQQQQQLDLIRKESTANGRLHVNHLEALIEGLSSGA